MTISTAISDLFFAHDNDNAARYERASGKPVFNGWDRATLEGNAQAFLELLEEAGLAGLPSNTDLVDDFLGRQ